MQVLQAAIQLLERVWRFHYHVPEAAYWALSLLSPVVALIAAGESSRIVEVGVLSTVVGLQGIVRWHLDRGRTRGKLVIPRFRCTDAAKAKEIQGIVMTALQDHLTTEEASRVAPVAAMVGPEQRGFATRLWRRLRAHQLLHGEIRESAGGGWAVFARVVQPTGGLIHADPFTRDVLPAKAARALLYERLTPTVPVTDHEYPLEFATELEAVIRGTAGQVAEWLEDYPRAEGLLKEAIAVAPTSTSAQIDALRASLALVLARQDREAEAFALLRPRVAVGNASPELLRMHHRLLVVPPRKPTPAEVEEGKQALRQALARRHRDDPLRDRTRYNLANVLKTAGTEDEVREAEEILNDLHASRGYYAGAWYVKLALGALAWGRMHEARADGDPDAARRHAKEAARLYSAACRARPRIRLLLPHRGALRLVAMFQRSPLMIANAHDAHREAGHRLRARWYHWRAERWRGKLMKRAFRFLDKGDFRGAYANADWAQIVGRHDELDVTARALMAVALQQLDRKEEAAELWVQAFFLAPMLAMATRNGIAMDRTLPEGVPGPEPVAGPPETMQFLQSIENELNEAYEDVP